MSRQLFHVLGRWLGLVFLLGITGATYGASLTISPIVTDAPVLGSRTFQATASGLATSELKWFVNNVEGGSTSLGTISTTGTYLAPASAGLVVTVTVASVSDPSVSASAQVTTRNRVPWLYGTSPTTLPIGPYTLDIIGDRFVAGAKAYVAGVAVSTTFISDKQLRISGQIASGLSGTQTLMVENPGPVASALYLKLSVVNTAAVPALQPAPPADAATVAAARFLEQASFGPNAADLSFVKNSGMRAWLDRQFDPAQTAPSVLASNLDVNQAEAQAFINMTHGGDQLRQRMTFALSQILVISADKNTNGNELVPWINLLSANAFGNYRDLLQELTLDSSMGKFLDLVNSRQSTPGNQNGANENYARELMQLFTIGLIKLNQDGTPQLDGNGQTIPTYTQADIRSYARALTGWTYPTQPGSTSGASNWVYYPGKMEPLPQYHDINAKTLLNGTVLPAGRSIQQDVDGVVDNLFAHPNLPPFIATRLIRSLVGSNPSPAYVQRVADVFAGTSAAPGYALAPRGDLKATLAAVLLDTEARQDTPSADQGHLKDPVLHVIGLARALGAQIADPGMFLYLFGYLGERVLDAPTVFSFYSPLTALPGHSDHFGPEFQIYSPAQAIQRANMIYDLLNNQFGAGFQVNLSAYEAVAQDPNSLLNKINDALFQGRMSPELRQTLYTLAVAHTDLKQRTLMTLYLAAISSEYTVAL